MTLEKPEYSKGNIDRAGDIFRKGDAAAPDEMIWADKVLNNWRASHMYPLNAFKPDFARNGTYLSPVKRLKRAPTIKDKLTREPGMRLSRMQDIGGARMVFSDISTLNQFLGLNNPIHQFALHHEKNYLMEPKESGYRGIHRIYKYQSQGDWDAAYNGMPIELQLRTRMQHVWSTTVEMMSMFLNMQLKSSRGDNDWLTFFKVASEAIAYLENYTGVVTEEAYDCYKRLKDMQQKLQFIERLDALRMVSGDMGIADYYLIKMSPDAKSIELREFYVADQSKAAREYEDAEKNNTTENQVVLVSAESFEDLKKGYPNYFLDTGSFINLVANIEHMLDPTNLWRSE